MRAAEQRAIAGGTGVEQLMERAGTVLAEAVYRFAGPMPALFLCGQGNNGGDGYIAASKLAQRGVAVRIAAIGEPRSEAANLARSKWSGDVERLANDTVAAPLLIDCLFGTGLRNGIEDTVCEQLSRLSKKSVVTVACDLPSGVESDGGAELSAVSQPST